MKGSKKKIFIIIAAILLVALVIVGIVMLLTQSDGKKDNNDKNEKQDFRCVGDLCISNVTVSETEDTKEIVLLLKNEGKTTINKQCVKLSSGEYSFNFCPNELKAGEELALSFEYGSGYGTKIEDYKLEEGVEEGTTTETEIAQ